MTTQKYHFGALVNAPVLKINGPLSYLAGIAKRAVLAGSVGMLGLVSGAYAQTYQAITLTGGNTSLSNLQFRSTGFPYSSAGGTTSLGGVPFIVPNPGNNAWLAGLSSNTPSATSTLTGTQTLTENATIANIYGVYTLASLYFGDSSSHVTYTFNFSDATSYTVALTGNVDLRDYNIPSPYANSINGTTTRNAFSGPSIVTSTGLAQAGHTWNLDRQFVALPVAHQGKTLSSFVVTDTGAPGVSRIFLTALTAQIGAATQAQSIVFGSTPTPTFSSGGTFSVTATAVPSGLPVTFSSLSPGVCSTSSTSSPATVTMLSGGVCTIAANQGGDATFSPALQETLNITIAGGAIATAGIPTLSEWGMIVMAGLMVLVAFVARRRQQH
jgi:hypothetical protein